ncbi:MAG: aminoacyl-tRNA hydrolase [Alphaproteobacteria bacterium]
MRLIVGLGNPGPEHAGDRHNIGFMAVDVIARRHGLGPFRKRFDGETAEGRIGDHRILLLKPTTYMNLSGNAVVKALAFYRLEATDVIVIHDELDLRPGKVRVKRNGGAAGHNGLRNIDSHIGRDYLRVRLGIGHPGEREAVLSYVLRSFSRADLDWLAPLLDEAADALPLLLDGDENAYMTRLAQNAPPPAPLAGNGEDPNDGI